MAIFAEVTANLRIIERHLHDIHPLLDYDASESWLIRLKLTKLLLVGHGYFVFFLTVRLRMHTHGLAIDICPSVCPSVCLSVKRVNCDKTK